MKESTATIQVDVQRLRDLTEENRKLSIENQRLRDRVAELEKEVHRLRDMWGDEITSPGTIPK